MCIRDSNKNPKGAAPKAPPCCLPFGKDFLCFGLISGAHPEAFPPSFFWDCPPSLVLPILGAEEMTLDLEAHRTRRLQELESDLDNYHRHLTVNMKAMGVLFHRGTPWMLVPQIASSTR